MIWERLAGLSLVVDGYSLERLEAEGYERATTQIRLSGAGESESARTWGSTRSKTPAFR